ncbi:MAG TPA: DNRLRE domain-containing protein [Chitinophagaceae bacterium]|nr:DNRLRE domain-containing protein [Chitinophagaceae bacterium]
MRTCLLLFILTAISSTLFSQTRLPGSSNSFLFVSDENTRSALISNTYDKRGDESQLLGTGAFTSNEALTQCRSLLAFDYSKFKERIKPEDIEYAELLLYPVVMENENLKKAEFPDVTVSRVAEKWNDSLTTWENQPAADEYITRVKKISPKTRKSGIVSFNVTNQVIDMFLKGNYGFLISSSEENLDNSSSINWFASAKHNETWIRPVLIIKVKATTILGNSNDDRWFEYLTDKEYYNSRLFRHLARNRNYYPRGTGFLYNPPRNNSSYPVPGAASTGSGNRPVRVQDSNTNNNQKSGSTTTTKVVKPAVKN